jgi:hypothetical protein
MFRRTTVVPWAIFIFVIVMVVIGIRLYASRPEFTRFNAIERVKNQPSAIHASLTIRYAKPPIFEEQFTTEDINGVSSFQYRIRSFAGNQVTVTAPPHSTTDVSYFFGKLVQDGVWDLMDKPPVGDTSARYTIYVKQTADFQTGDRTVTFTDPHYWATTAGRQYSIDLRKTNPSDLLKLQSTSLADPRYLQIVNDFRAFGPPGFQDKVASVRASFARGGNGR